MHDQAHVYIFPMTRHWKSLTFFLFFLIIIIKKRRHFSLFFLQILCWLVLNWAKKVFWIIERSKEKKKTSPGHQNQCTHGEEVNIFWIENPLTKKDWILITNGWRVISWICRWETIFCFLELLHTVKIDWDHKSGSEWAWHARIKTAIF